MTHLALGIDPEPLGVAPFIMSARLLPEVLAADLGPGRAPAGAGRRVPGARRLRRRRHRRRAARLRHGPGQAHPAVHRHRHQLRDRARQRRLAARRRPRRPGRRSRARRSGAGCGPPTARSRCVTIDRRTALDADGHRRREPAGLCGSGLVDAVAELVRVGLLDPSGRFVPDEDAATVAPGAAPTADHARRRSGCSCCTGSGEPGDVARLDLPVPARRPRAAVRQGGDRHRLEPCCSRRPGSTAADVQQVLLAGSFGSYLSPGQRDPARAGAAAARAARRQRGQRGRRGREDGAAVDARAGRGAGAAGGGEICRALRPRRLQRPVRRAAAVPA